MPTIRPETPADFSSVREVNERAFERTAEADLVEVLRDAAEMHLSLVAEEDGQVIGHIFFSPVTVESASGRSANLFGLAPMAVLPEWQRQGIGASLMRNGLQACRESGCHAVVVLGHSEYYPRFGFQPARVFGLRSEYDVPSEAFMALELIPGALGDVSGMVKYNAAFDQVE